MPPPPVPFFRGGTLRASEKDGLIAFRPEPGYALWSPPATTVLYLPAATILRVTVEPFSEPGWASLSFHGEFSRVSRPEDVVLAPVSEDDAHALVAALNERLGLPRTPKPVMPHELVRSTQGQIAWNTYLTVVGTQAAEPRHFETADFSGCALTGDQARIAGRIPGKRYLVVGFYQPGCAPGSMVLGYKGPKIVVMAIRPEPDGALRDEARWWHPPPSPSTRGKVRAWLRPTPDHGHRQLEFSTSPEPGTLVVGALDGSGGQGTGSYAARASQLVLATLLAEPAYEPLLGPPVEPPANAFHDLAAWVAWLVDRRHLPREPAAMVTLLGTRIGAVLEGLNLRSYALSGGGILAVVRRGRATILRRGVARAYLVRAGQLTLLLHEDTMGRAPQVLADPEMARAVEPHRWIPVSRFQPADPQSTLPPLEIEVQHRDRLIFVVGSELVQALEDPAREALLAGPEPDVVADLAPTQEMGWQGWGVVSVDIDQS